ncbi:hypothetical protein [Phyllobacterium sp. SB3]|uniref:hypothetical protein n=1 Tax=Phyllobacterium sp. SB3 TaxID=3156073 RepID=UPI0032AF5156
MTLTQAERITRLEVKMEGMEKQLAGMDEKLTELHGIFLQGKGARYTIIAAAGILGFIASWFPSLLQYLVNIAK